MFLNQMLCVQCPGAKYCKALFTLLEKVPARHFILEIAMATGGLPEKLPKTFRQDLHPI